MDQSWTSRESVNLRRMVMQTLLSIACDLGSRRVKRLNWPSFVVCFHIPCPSLEKCKPLEVNSRRPIPNSEKVEYIILHRALSHRECTISNHACYPRTSQQCRPILQRSCHRTGMDHLRIRSRLHTLRMRLPFVAHM